ncbi:MAG: 4-hydroxy-tetrahydrodipicolinate synthase [Thermoguttaceae bacterium]
MAEKFHGLFPALVTPMTADEQVDHKTLADFINYLIDEGGVHGIIPLGSTGEYYALSAQERSEVLKTTIQTVAGRVPVVAGANAGSTRDVVQYCREAEKLGASGVLLAPPYYSLPRDDELVAHFRAASDAIGIPIMLYNYPGRTGVDMQPDLIERLAELKQVRYVKESTGDITRISEIIRRLGDGITVFCGCDTIALESLLLGTPGWVSGTANVLPREHVEIYRIAVEKNDFLGAKAPFYKLMAFLALAEGGGKYTQYVKAGCGLTGHPVGPPRRPLLPIGAEETAKLKKAIAEVRR